MRDRRSIILTLVVTAAAPALLAAGCGGGGPSPGVASGAPSTNPAPTTATTQSRPRPAGKASGDAPAGTGFQMAMDVGNAKLGAQFSSCMRKHGVQNFPDPNSQGAIQLSSGMGINPNSPTFRSARSACQKLLPNGGQPTPQQQAQRQQQMLAFSKCMRAHGIEDFPDPSNDGIRIHAGQGSALNPQNPRFQAA